MKTYISVRPFSYGDEVEIKKIVARSTLSTVNAFFRVAVTKESVIQSCIMLSALFFIILGVPLHLCWISFPLVALTLYVSIYIAHWHRITTRHSDLDQLETVYGEDERCGFWVAESWEANDVKNDDGVEVVGQEAIQKMEGKLRRGRLVGTVGLVVMEDRDKREPPNSVGFLKRLSVLPGYRHLGVGQQLVTTAFRHAMDHKYRAVQLVATDCHYAARSFFDQQEWKMTRGYQKQYLAGIVRIGMCVYRKPCIRTTSQD